MTIDIKVYYRDTDCGGVVYYANYLDYFERARTEWMEEKGVSISSLKQDGIQFVVKSAGIDYISPAVYAEVITIDVELTRLTGASITFAYEVKEKKTGRSIVSGHTDLVCVDSSMKPCRIPKSARDRLSSYAVA